MPEQIPQRSYPIEGDMGETLGRLVLTLTDEGLVTDLYMNVGPAEREELWETQAWFVDEIRGWLEPAAKPEVRS